ncbi:unnamed protein product [Lepidochelys kempii]
MWQVPAVDWGEDLQGGVSGVLTRSMLGMAAVEVPETEEWKKQIPGVWAKDKYDCGLWKGESIVIQGPLVPPQKQFKYPPEAEQVVGEILDALIGQGVVHLTTSPFNSLIWPVHKADGKTWRLTIDYRRINACTPQWAPVVADMTALLLESILPKAKWFSVIDLETASLPCPWLQRAKTDLLLPFAISSIRSPRFSRDSTVPPPEPTRP